MVCENCGSILDAADAYCGNCGAQNNSSSNKEEVPAKEHAPQPSAPNPQLEQVTDFFKNSFLGIVKSLLTKPIAGTYEMFNNAKEEAYQHAVILLCTTGLAYVFLPYFFFNKYMGLALGDFFKIGIVIIIVLMSISILSFLIKGISGKPDFKKELLTGGLCGIPMILYLLYMCFFGASALEMLNFSNMGQFGVLTFLMITYVFLMLINIIQQSLRSAKTNDALNWYISPIVLILSLYIGATIGKGLFS
ncbi:MAG: zinc ribbon domain-containing protein [Saprospiraceae bacterium]